MNEYQQKLYNLAQDNPNLGKMSLRQIANLIGASNKPQIAKHHLLQLDKKGLLRVNLSENIINVVKRGVVGIGNKTNIFSLPIVGSANCGPATIFANERIEGYLKISSKRLPHRKKELYVIIASGNSMNNTNVNGKNIEDGDYVVVDSNYSRPRPNDVVVSVIDGLANIKKYKLDQENKQIILVSESTEKGHHPIFVDESDLIISGKVVDIIKNPNL
ncbi:S24 family peptidase [Patescibacteria group bacterium]|nr:S24 family peptidase [Patescibacteria group bacterium]